MRKSIDQGGVLVQNLPPLSRDDSSCIYFAKLVPNGMVSHAAPK